MDVSASPDVVALALVPAVLWGFAPVLSKRGMAAGGGALQAALVVVVVDSLLYWTGLFARHGLDVFAGLSTDVLFVFVFSGVVGTALGRVATFAGVKRLGASVNSAGISTRPLFATALAATWLGEPVGATTVVGVLLLSAGLVTLTLAKGGDIRGWDRRHLLYPLAAAAMFGLGNVIRRFGLEQSPITALEAVALNETAALAVLAAFAVATTDARERVLRAPRRSYLYFVGSGTLTAIALLSLFTALGLREGRVSVVDPLAATAPLFTTVFAYFLLSDLERVTKGVVAGATLVVVGGALVTL